MLQITEKTLLLQGIIDFCFSRWYGANRALLRTFTTRAIRRHQAVSPYLVRKTKPKHTEKKERKKRKIRTMKTHMKLTMLAAVALALSAATETNADPITYDVTFNGGGSAANGQVTVDNGVATGGYLDVTAGAAIGDYTLYTWAGGGSSSFRVDGGTDIIVDNLVNVLSNPALDVKGLGFYSGTQVGGDYPEGINLSLLSGTTINLSGFGTDGYGNPNANGELTLTAVPDNMNTGAASTAGIGCLFLASAKRKPLMKLVGMDA
jgi:hypothetical protein